MAKKLRNEDGSIMLLQRHIQEIAYQDDMRVTPDPIRLRPNLIKQFDIHTKIDFTVQNIAFLQPDYPWRLMRHITVRSVRNEILKTVDARALHFMNYLERGTDEYSTFPINVIFGQQYSLEYDTCIPFEDKVGRNPEKTILNSNEFTELYLDFDFDFLANIFNETLEDIDVTMTIVPLEREPMQGQPRDRLEKRKKLIDQTYLLPVQGDHIEYLLPENTLIKDILLIPIGADGARFDTSTGDPILNVSIEDNDQEHSIREWSGPQIRSMNKQYYGIETGLDGVYAIPFDQERDLSSCYKTYGVNYSKLLIDLDDSIIVDGDSVLMLIRQVATPPLLIQPK